MASQSISFCLLRRRKTRETIVSPRGRSEKKEKVSNYDNHNYLS